MPRYQLLAGQHVQADPSRGINPETKKLHTRKFQPGDVFESDSWVCAADVRKFRRVDAPAEIPELTPDPAGAATAVAVDATPPRFLRDELEAMTLAQLRELAASENIDIEGAGNKGVVIRLILAET